MHRELRWPIIDKDDAKDVLMASPLCSLEQDANALSYSIMFRAAEAQLRCGMSVIIDCPLAYVELYHQALAIASRVRQAPNSMRPERFAVPFEDLRTTGLRLFAVTVQRQHCCRGVCLQGSSALEGKAGNTIHVRCRH